MVETIVEGIDVIDADSHVTEPLDLWTSRVSKRWGDDVPHAEWDRESEVLRWRIGGAPTLAVGALSTAGWRDWYPSAPPTLEEADSAAFDPHERLQRMNEYGVHAQVLYPNLVGFVTWAFMRLEPQLSFECIRASNDFLTDFASSDPTRLLPIAMLPFWDVDESVREMERCKEKGHKGVLFSATFGLVDLPDIADPRWAPILEAAQGLELPINFHIGFSEAKQTDTAAIRSLDRAALARRVAAQSLLGNARPISYVTLNGVCHRYPRLKFVSVESGFGYVPWLLQALDWEFDNFGVRLDHPEWLRPSEYFHRQVYATFWFERVNADMVAEFQDNLMFETDFPHPQSLSPGPNTMASSPSDTIKRNLANIEGPVLRKILHDNAARLYQLEQGGTKC
jgi:predicted TIM-barrel fold metal-dependent hydrolase